jgi:hypothetical protein
MELRKIPVCDILNSFHNLTVNEGIPGAPFSLESSRRQPSQTRPGKVSIAQPDQIRTPLGDTTSNALAGTVAQKHILGLVKPAEGILHEIKGILVMGGIGGIKKELEESARTEDRVVASAMLSGCRAIQGVAQDSEDKDGQPLHLFASPPGDLTVREA